MPFQVKAPAGESYYLDECDAYYSTTERTLVVIREATQAEDRQRSSLFAEITRVMDPNGSKPGEIQIKQTLNNDDLVEMDIFLTLADSNIQDENGDSLFRFRQVGSIRKLDMSLADFRKALGMLPGRVVEEIHRKVALKNPDWFGPVGE